MTRPEPAVVIWGGLIVAALAADAWLIHRGDRLLTDVARTPTGRLIRGVLSLHFDKQLGRFDPFTVGGALIQRSTRCPSASPT